MNRRTSAQRVAERHLASNDGMSKGLLQGLLGMFHAIYWLHWTTHWQTKGNPYYGDHLLFERLYGALPAEIDTLAEKLVQLHGSEAVDIAEHHPVMGAWLGRWIPEGGGDLDPVGRALAAERDFQKSIRSTYEDLKAEGELSLGLDDFLMSTANAHETHLYLLQQRMGGILNRSASLAPRVKRQVDGIIDWMRPLEVADLASEFRTSWRELQREHPDIYRSWSPADFQEASAYLESRSKYASEAPSAEAHFFDSPRKRETAEFAESGALTNIPNVSSHAKYDNGKPKAERHKLNLTPLTPEEVVNATPGSDEFSTLSRYVVHTEHPTDRGVPQSHDSIPKHPDIK